MVPQTYYHCLHHHHHYLCICACHGVMCSMFRGMSADATEDMKIIETGVTGGCEQLMWVLRTDHRSSKSAVVIFSC